MNSGGRPGLPGQDQKVRGGTPTAKVCSAEVGAGAVVLSKTFVAGVQVGALAQHAVGGQV